MATKKTVKKTQKKPVSKVSVVPVAPFNKQNALALADIIFSDKAGVMRTLKLCNGTLSNGKDGGRTLHCAVGEAYFNFVSRDMSTLNKEATALAKKQGHGSKTYCSVHIEDSDVVGGATALAIDRLVDAAALKSNTKEVKAKLVAILNDAVETNDEANESDFRNVNLPDKEREILSHLTRSMRVAEVFRKKVAPLLK